MKPYPPENTGIIQKMKENFLTKDFLLFVLCGGMGTVTNFLVSLIVSTRLDPVLSYVIAYGISLFVTYTLNAKLVFSAALKPKDFIRFVISYVPNFFILFSFVYVFINRLYWNKVIVYALAGLLGIPVTYILVKVFAFRGGKD